MIHKNYKIAYFTIFFFFVILAWPVPGEAYNVSGVVEFSYRNYETKIGSTRTSQSTFIQNYHVNLQDYLFDPRFLQFSAGIGYAVYNTKQNTAPSQDSSTLNYNLNASFFPQSKINGNIFGNKTMATIESNANIAGYDVTTSSYGASLNLLFAGSRFGGNNNNNNYSNERGYGYRIPLPTINISYIHTDSDSESLSNPIHEKRDDTNAALTYRFNPSFDIRLDGGMQTYENEISNSSYEQKTANLASTIDVSKDGELRLNGRITDMSTDNIAGFQADVKTHNYGAILDFKERNGWKQYYRYDNSGQKTTNSESTTQRAEANVRYRILPELQLIGGVDYSTADLFTSATVSAPEQESNVKQADVLAGASYQKSYALNMIYPFNFNTNYDFNFGYSKVESQMAGIEEGTGMYYTNQAGLALASSGWQQESINLNYFIFSKRDSSPLSNDVFQQSFRFDFNTRRVTDTNIRAKADYYSQEIKSSASAIFSSALSDTREQRRSFTYDIGADYHPIENLTFSAGAQRGETKSSFTTLSTLQPVSSVSNVQNLYYASAAFNYSFTRNLLYRLNYLEQLSTTEVVDIRTHVLNMNLDYRFRQIFVNFEYRWRQEIPDNSQTTTQQYYFVKLSRPF